MKKLLALVLALALALSIGASAALAEEKLNITMMDTLTVDNGMAFTQAVLDSIEAYRAASGNEVTDDHYPDQTAYQEKIYTLAAANELPDLFYLKGSWMTEFVGNDWAADITDVLAQYPEFVSMFNEGAFSNFTRDGRIYGVPTESMVTSVVFYNKELWNKAGYESFPTDWDELIAAAAKFEEMGIPMFVMGNKANWPAESCWFSTIGNFGTGSAWTDAILAKDGSASYTDPGMIEALGKFQQLALTPGALNADINSLAEDQAREVFFNNQAATIVEGTWFISQIEATNPANIDSIELAILPAWKGAAGDANAVSGGPAWSYAISKKTLEDESRAKAVIEALLTVAGEETVRKSLQGGNVMAATVDFDTSALGPITVKYLDMMKDKYTVAIYDACMESGVVETFNSNLQELLIGKKTPEDMAAETQMEYEMAMLG